jgi:hypothetical protein
MLAHRLAQTIEEGAIILQFDRVDRAAGLRIAHVLVAVGFELLELALEVGDLADRPPPSRGSKSVGRCGGDS